MTSPIALLSNDECWHSYHSCRSIDDAGHSPKIPEYPCRRLWALRCRWFGGDAFSLLFKTGEKQFISLNKCHARLQFIRILMSMATTPVNTIRHFNQRRYYRHSLRIRARALPSKHEARRANVVDKRDWRMSALSVFLFIIMIYSRR